ncbi:DUF1254 domain-containing protein [Flavihumibacter petaseus]|nr:DUF1254 domain-containing protein [Flavihumibacter petaseus]
MKQILIGSARLITIGVLVISISMYAACNNAGNTKSTNDSTAVTSAKDTTVEVVATHSTIAPASTDITMHPEYAKTLARFAYTWGYPMVNMLNRKNTLSKAPQPGLLGGVLPAAPTGRIAMLHDYIDPGQTFIACPNQDVVYGLGFFSLDDQPVVIQVPDFGSRFFVYALYDARTDQIGEIGQPYGTKPGFYLLKGPNWKGNVPAGITGVLTSPTSLGNCIPRVFMDDTPEDRAAIQPLINQITVYPLSEFDGKMKTTEWKNAPIIPNPNAGNGGAETKWVIPEKFFDELGTVLETVPPLPGEEALYSQLKSLLAVAKRDPAIQKLITNEAIAMDKSLVKDFIQWKYNGKPAGNNWNRSQNNAEWGFDYFNRAGTSRSNMFDNRPNETQYFYTDYTASGEKLHGKSNYKITFKVLPPVKGFWSMTLYNKEHFFYPNDFKRYSLGTKNKTLQKNADGTLTLYAGNKNPGKDKESNWLPSPNEDFSLYIRAYWGEAGITDGSWVPPVVEKY